MVVLLNWLTQGAIVAVVAAAGLHAIPASRARARYGFIWAAILLVLALPAVPLIPLPVEAPALGLATAPADPVLAVPAVWWTSAFAATGFWIVWFAVQAVRFGVGVASVRHARRHSRQCPEEVLARLDHWPRVSGTGRPTRVVLSGDVRFAAVLGCGAPVIALAPALVDQLSAIDLDRVLIHEWAHVQRRDDVVQLVQRFVRMIVGWHPAAWWLERQLDFEREAACDQVAIGITGSAKGYASCLATLAALPKPPVRPLPALAAVSSTGLRRRLTRILMSPVAAARPWRAAVACAAGGLTAVGLTVGNMRAVTWATVSVAARDAVPDVVVTGVSEPIVPLVGPVARMSAARTPAPGQRRAATPKPEPSPVRTDVRAMDPPPEDAMPSLPLRQVDWKLGAAAVSPVATPALTAIAPSPQVEKDPSPWTAPATAGVALGRASRTAGAATGGFFTRLGKSIAHSF